MSDEHRRAVDEEFARIADAQEVAETDRALVDFASGLGKLRVLLVMSGFAADEAFTLTRDFAQTAMQQQALTSYFDVFTHGSGETDDPTS